MMSTVVYKGELRCECTHIQSGTVIETDAPTDNRGKGERFSPTDTLCVALATCAITTMALKAKDNGLELQGSVISVTKHMLAEPRRIGKIEVALQMKCVPEATEKDRILLQRVGDNCPVAKSLDPNLELLITYQW